MLQTIYSSAESCPSESKLLSLAADSAADQILFISPIPLIYFFVGEGSPLHGYI